MKHIGMLLIWLINLAFLAHAADLSSASSQDLLAVYKQLREIQRGDKSATTENVVFKRDAAVFIFASGRITFAAPVAGQVLAAQFQGEGKFELVPPSTMDQRQLARFAKNTKLEDTFQEAIFYFTDDTFAEMSKLMRIRDTPGGGPSPFAASQRQYSESYNGWVDNTRKGMPGTPASALTTTGRNTRYTPALQRGLFLSPAGSR